MMEKLHYMKKMLEHCAAKEMENIENVDTEELGEVIDMIKDLEEAMYYHSIRKAMEYPTEQTIIAEHQVKTYKELKEGNADKAILMQELERYMNNIVSEIMEIASMATPEEKAYLMKKVTTLHTRLSAE